jgi:hypothetical protein
LIDYALQQIVLRLLAMEFIAAVHDAAVAGTACALGDPEVSLWFALVNLLPPLTGAHLLVAIAPGARAALRRMQPYVAVALAVTGLAALAPAYAVLARAVLAE